jgi:hypothetical protein
MIPLASACCNRGTAAHPSDRVDAVATQNPKRRLFDKILQRKTGNSKIIVKMVSSLVTSV